MCKEIKYIYIYFIYIYQRGKKDPEESISIADVVNWERMFKTRCTCDRVSEVSR